MATLQDWKRELEGESELDESEFADFIPRNGDDAFLQEAFASLPNGQILIKRLQELLSENDNSGLYVVPRKENWRPLSSIREFAEEYRRNLSKYLISIGQAHVSNEVLSEKVQIVYRNSDFYDAIRGEPFPHSEALSVIENRFIDELNSLGSYMFALNEAVLFLTKYPGITRYIIESTIKFPLNHEPYYKLWRSGGDIYFFKERVLLLCEYGAD